MERPQSSRRRRSLFVSIVCATSIVLMAPALAQAAPRAQASIIRGDVASIADFPSLAFVTAENRQGQGFACTGTVIAARVVLTAAHCVEDLNFGGLTPANEFAVATGRADPSQAGSGNLLPVSDTHVFPGFDPGTTHGDAALLVLAGPTSAPAIPLATSADSGLYEGGAEVLVAGWGLTRPGATSPPKSLRSTSNVVLSPAACKQRTRSYYSAYSSALEMCTTDPPDRANGGCFGDSGGPALARRPDGSLVEIGVLSTGGPRCSTKLPNIFTRTDRLSTWAAEWVGAIELGTPPPTLKPRLPAMTQESAQGFVVGLLSARFGELFRGGHGLRGVCRRLGSPRMRCELSWRFGARIYFGTVIVFYVLRQDALAWDNSYVVRRANARCLEGDRPRSCRVETRRG